MKESEEEIKEREKIFKTERKKHIDGNDSKKERSREYEYRKSTVGLNAFKKRLL